ncbi:MAG TPA: DUF6518 family protein [Thermoleophilaceae bacterium]
MQLAHLRRAILFGAALGLATRYGSQFPGDFDWLRRVGVPWLAVGFAAAISVPRVRHGALLGALSLVVAILVYYAALAFLQDAYDRSPLGVAWLVIALPGGAVFGTLGSLWSAGRERVTISAVLAACFLGEAVIFDRFLDPAAAPYLLGAAVAMPVLLLRRTADRLAALALALPFMAAAVVVEGVVFLSTGYLISA